MREGLTDLRAIPNRSERKNFVNRPSAPAAFS